MGYNRVHLICRREQEGAGLVGVKPIDHPKFKYAYESGRWNFSKADAQHLLGGLIFLHQTKKTPSNFGGLIYDWFESKSLDAARQDRISFRFLAVTDARHVRWSGQKHSMAWQSAIVPPDEPIVHDVPISQRNVGKGFRSLSDLPVDFVQELQDRAKGS